MRIYMDPCAGCGLPKRRMNSRSRYCLPCDSLLTKWVQFGCRSVKKAKKAGVLSIGPEDSCADCGGAAIEFEHRDYTRPLDVVPICRSCNLKRGPVVWRDEYRQEPPRLKVKDLVEEFSA